MLILSRPIDLHKAAESDIDFRTIRALHEVKRIQLSEIDRLKKERKGVYNPLVNPPIFIICPNRPLRMGKPWLWFHRKSMETDIKDGLSVGDQFYEDLQRALSDGNNAAIEKYCILTKVLPKLPAEEPQYPWWYSFANTSWLSPTAQQKNSADGKSRAAD